MGSIKDIEDFPKTIDVELAAFHLGATAASSGGTANSAGYDPVDAVIKLPYVIRPNGHVVCCELLALETMFPHVYYKPDAVGYSHTTVSPSIRLDLSLVARRSVQTEDKVFPVNRLGFSYNTPDLIAMESKSWVLNMPEPTATVGTVVNEIYGGSVLTERLTHFQDLTIGGKGRLVASDSLIVYCSATKLPAGTLVGWQVCGDNTLDLGVTESNYHWAVGPSVRIWYRLRELTPFQHTMLCMRFNRKPQDDSTPYNARDSLVFTSNI